MNSKTLLALSVIIVTLIISLPIIATNAVSVGVCPADEIEIKDALKGGEYERMITVFNGDEDEGGYMLTAEGEHANWVSFSAEKITIPGKSSEHATIKVKIPEDTANGEYNITVTVKTIPVEAEGEQVSSVALGASITLRVEVVGEQILSGAVDGITVTDTEVNYPLKIAVSFRNTGNVIATPHINVKIMKDGTEINSFTYSETNVKPGFASIIPLEWNTSKAEPGDYIAKISVSLSENTLATEDLPFRVLPLGTLTREGVLTDLLYDGELIPGRVLKIIGEFKNTGWIETKAKLIGEVYLNGALVDTISSEELTIPIASRDLLICYLKTGEAGDYTVKAYVVYEGKKTDMKEISFTIPKPGIQLSFEPTTFAPIIAAVLATGVYVVKRKNAKKRW